MGKTHWKNPEETFRDAVCKAATFLRAIAYRVHMKKSNTTHKFKHGTLWKIEDQEQLEYLLPHQNVMAWLGT